MPFSPSALEKFSTQPGVYLMKNAKSQVIYVGKAKNLKNRLKQYFAQSSSDTRAMIPFLIEQIDAIDTIVVPSEKEALLLENTLIKKHQPKFNAFLKDDKTFISLMINHTHPWPMLRLVRYKGTPKEQGLFFGPYTSAYAARQTYELLTRLFPLRQCSDEELKRRTRPCLLYDIKRCVAPCVQKCTPTEYDALVQKTIQFLKGQDRHILEELKAEMDLASEAQEYERAGALLQTIRQIEHVISSDTLIHKATGSNSDVLALYRQAEEIMLVQMLFREGKLIGSEHYPFSGILEEDEDLLSSFILQHYTKATALPQEILLPFPLKNAPLLSEILSEAHGKKILLATPQKGDKKALIRLAEENAKALFQQEKDQRQLKEKMLLDLQETLKLNRYPKKIVCFDTSHLYGKDAVAALITFIDGIKEKKETRLFRVKSSASAEDYTAMREVIHRYLIKAKQNDQLPDLIVVDGGKGQLNIALDLFKELDIASVDLIALTKEEGRHDKGITKERIFLPQNRDPIHLNERSNLLFLLQQIRDETHRQALLFHQKRRTKRTLTSALDAVEGIGPIKRKRLLTHFGSVEQIRRASDEELRAVPGIGPREIAALRKALEL